jgi:dipeptidyl aminopeptidase/acylaminoacyl peptidase
MAKRRGALFALLALACLAGTAAAIASALGQEDGDGKASAAVRGALSGSEPVVVFRSLDRASADARGEVALASLSDPGRREPASLRCDRVHYAAERGICLARKPGFAGGYQAKVFGADMRVEHAVDVQGVPSRARVSPDGRYGSVTLFVTGHAYAEAGSFSTQTTLIDLERGEKIAELEDFTVTNGGKQVTAVDRNFWGVTYARDSDRFFATMATGGKTYLIQGSVSRRTAHTLHENVECPSLSPDGTRIAYKKRVDSAEGPWRLAVLDLETMRETLLAETRSVDDQAEWLDDDHVLYGTDREIWSVSADGSGEPSRFIARGESPAVVHR